ncbi:hypothetical protein LB506_006709 [Fusarium annulatum]|nr:hypothetical protein LB506_006709 [Fusarium annulatum]
MTMQLNISHRTKISRCASKPARLFFCPIISLMRDTSACVSNTGMRNYVSRDVILEDKILLRFR